MRQALSLLLILLISAGLTATSATAEEMSIPGDLDDLLVSDEELKAAEEKRDAGEISEEELAEIRLINERYPRTITDSVGRTVTIYRPLERVVVFNSATIEIMRSLNTSNIIVGVDRYTKEDGIFFPEMAGEEISEVGTTDAPDYEAVLGTEPEAVFVYATNRVASSEEIQKTRRRANALEYVLIPDLRQAKRVISSRLEEIARSDVRRLMKVTLMLLEREMNPEETSAGG